MGEGDVAEGRTYPVIGGVASRGAPLLGALAALGTGVAAGWDLAVAVVLLLTAIAALWPRVVVQVSGAALVRGRRAGRTTVGALVVIPWPRVTTIHTDWRRPGDDTALETVVTGADGAAIRFSSTMGLHAYRACLADVTARAPRARRAGLTEAVLASRSARGELLPAAATAAGLALLLAALVGLHYVWAQGKSSLARQLEAVERSTERDAGQPPLRSDR